jgi:hypothetical protein
MHKHHMKKLLCQSKATFFAFIIGISLVSLYNVQ